MTPEERADAPRLSIRFEEADAVWAAIFAWRKNPNGDRELGGILDAIATLVVARTSVARLDALEEAAKIADEHAQEHYDNNAIWSAERIAAAIRERAKITLDTK